MRAEDARAIATAMMIELADRSEEIAFFHAERLIPVLVHDFEPVSRILDERGVRGGAGLYGIAVDVMRDVFGGDSLVADLMTDVSPPRVALVCRWGVVVHRRVNEGWVFDGSDLLPGLLIKN